MSLYGQYLKEREGFEIIENDYGFASYKCIGQECYLRDLYVVPNKRKSHVASDLADQICEIGKQNGCKYLSGSVSPEDPNATRNIQVLIAYGMRLVRSTNDLLWFIKELN